MSILIGMSFAWCMKIQEQLKCSKSYLKTDYKIHIASESRCGDHCSNHALSSSEAEFRSRCKHKHNVDCDQCQMLKMTLQEIDDASKSSADTKLRFVSVVPICILIHATGKLDTLIQSQRPNFALSSNANNCQKNT